MSIAWGRLLAGINRKKTLTLYCNLKIVVLTVTANKNDYYWYLQTAFDDFLQPSNVSCYSPADAMGPHGTNTPRDVYCERVLPPNSRLMALSTPCTSPILYHGLT